MGQQEQTVLQGQVALKETLVSVTVASKGALKILKPNGQKQKKRKKNKVKFSASSRRTLNSRNWRKSQFHRKLFHKKRKPGFQKGKVLQRKKAAKRKHTYYTHKGQNAYGVRNSVQFATGYGGKKVSKVAKIRNRYNQVPHLTEDTNGKVTNSQKTPQTRAKRSALSQQVTTKHI